MKERNHSRNSKIKHIKPTHISIDLNGDLEEIIPVINGPRP